MISKSVKKIYKKNCENWGLNTLCFIVGGGGTMHNNWSACKRHCAQSLGFRKRTQFSHFPIDRILMKSGWNYLSWPLSRSNIIYLNGLPERNLKHGVIWWQQKKKKKIMDPRGVSATDIQSNTSRVDWISSTTINELNILCKKMCRPWWYLQCDVIERFWISTESELWRVSNTSRNFQREVRGK